MKIKSIKAITLSMPFSHGGKKVIFHGKEWKSLEFNLVKIETDKGITGWGEAFGYTSWKAVKIAIEEMVAPLLVGKDIINSDFNSFPTCITKSLTPTCNTFVGFNFY